LSGEIIHQPGDSANGMVMDFTEIKSLAQQYVIDLWDHSFLVYVGDAPVVEFLRTMPNHKTVELDCIPTAENLAEQAFAILDAVYRDTYGNHLCLEKVRLYETPNCWVDAVRK
jgi:6-pyruvoyltetrahydropterin/6-carboxytetrahydropterin synthase